MADKQQQIRDVIVHLDPTDNSLWRVGGIPKVSVVQRLTGDKTITRADIARIMPEFRVRRRTV